MNITREQLLKIIKEEYAAANSAEELNEGLAMAGFTEMMEDAVRDAVNAVHPTNIEELRSGIQAQGFDLTELVLKALDEAGVQEELSELGPNTTKTDFPAGASSEYPKMLEGLYEAMQSYNARYGKALPKPELMENVLDSILNLKARLKRLEESLY